MNRQSTRQDGTRPAREIAGGGVTPTEAFSDDWSIKLVVPDTVGAQSDPATFALALELSDTVDVQSETVQLAFPAPDFAEASAAPTDANTFNLIVWLANSAGAGVTNPGNANGQNDGAVATLQTVLAGSNFIRMTSDIGVNVPAGMSITSVIYTGWFKSVNTLITSVGKLTAHSTTAAFADLDIFTNSGLNTTVDHLSGDFTFDLFAAGINTLAKVQSLQMFHFTSDAAAGVTPHVMTVDAGNITIAGAFS